MSVVAELIPAVAVAMVEMVAMLTPSPVVVVVVVVLEVILATAVPELV